MGLGPMKPRAMAMACITIAFCSGVREPCMPSMGPATGPAPACMNGAMGVGNRLDGWTLGVGVEIPSGEAVAGVIASASDVLGSSCDCRPLPAAVGKSVGVASDA